MSIQNMTAQEAKELAQAKVTDRTAADRAPMNSGSGSLQNLIEKHERAARDRATEGGLENDGGRRR